MSINLSYGNTIARDEIADNRETSKLKKAFSNSAWDGICFEVSEENARRNGETLSKTEIGIFGEVELDDVNATDWDYDFQYGQAAVALALIKIKEALKDIDFGSANHKNKFPNPHNGSTGVWFREVFEEEEGTSLFFVYPDKHTTEFPKNGFFVNIEDDYQGSGPTLTIADGGKMAKVDPAMIANLIESFMNEIRRQEPEIYNQALKEVIEEVTEYGYEHADQMSFYYKGREMIDLSYAETFDSTTKRWEALDTI